MNTTWEKFQCATLSLARSGSIKDRLAEAYRDHLAGVSEDDLPKEIREDFRALSKAIKRETPIIRGEDSVQATVRKMSNADADRAASSVVRMFAALPRSPASAARGMGPALVVPLYIADGSTSLSWEHANRA